MSSSLHRTATVARVICMALIYSIWLQLREELQLQAQQTASGVNNRQF